MPTVAGSVTGPPQDPRPWHPRVQNREADWGPDAGNRKSTGFVAGTRARNRVGNWELPREAHTTAPRRGPHGGGRSQTTQRTALLRSVAKSNAAGGETAQNGSAAAQLLGLEGSPAAQAEEATTPPHIAWLEAPPRSYGVNIHVACSTRGEGQRLRLAPVARGEIMRPGQRAHGVRRMPTASSPDGLPCVRVCHCQQGTCLLEQDRGQEQRSAPAGIGLSERGTVPSAARLVDNTRLDQRPPRR